MDKSPDQGTVIDIHSSCFWRACGPLWEKESGARITCPRQDAYDYETNYDWCIAGRASHKSLCLAASPPPQMKHERVAPWARERPRGHTLVSSFFRAGRGRGTRLVRSQALQEG